jgi:uncharacterized phage protein (TIGR01671 family)
MREIKFRGKSIIDIGYIKKGNWIYGGISINDDRVWIDMDYIGQVAVEESTIGQFTGLHDKNGKEIYEGDILIAPSWFGNLKCVCIYQQENETSPVLGFGLYSYDNYFRKYRTLVQSDEWEEFEVIGNIYENKDLLED